MDETLDWMDEFDDSVLTDSIEANDSSALTGFDNTETEKETANPLEANETVKQPSGDFWDNLSNFTPTINFSRESGPPSSNNSASSSGSSSSTSGGSDSSSSSTSSGGSSGGDSGSTSGGSTTSGGSLSSRIKNAIATVTSASSAAVGSGGSVTSSLASGLSGIASKYGSEAAKDAGNATAKANAELQSAEQTREEVTKDFQEKVAAVQQAQNDANEFTQAMNTWKAYQNGENVSEADQAKAAEVFTKYGMDKVYDGVLTGGAFGANVSGADAETIKRANEQFAIASDDVYKQLKTAYTAADKAAEQAKTAYNNSIDASKEAYEKAQEALAREQALKDKAGTLAGEAGKAFERAQEKQKEWEQKQREAEDAARAEGKDGTTSDSAINNPVTLDLATSLANSGAKMTETEYKQVADFVANHPELASLINGGLTGAEKATIGNVIAGIQAINDGNYLTAAKEFAQGLGMSLVSAVQLISTGIYGAGARIVNIVKSFMENPDINYDNSEDFKTFKQLRDEYGDSTDIQALYDTSKGTTEQKQTFDYMKDNAATNVGEYNEGLVEDVNKVVSDASRKVIHYSPYVLEAVKKWR